MQQIADYVLVSSLGRGNSGEFFLAVPPARLSLAAEHVTVKVLAAPSGADALRRVTRELRAFADVRSPHLVRLLDAGQDGEHFFYAMEHLPLGSLAAPARPLARAEVLRAVADAARGARALHEAGLVHGGITTSTVLLADGRPEVRGRLSDLGLVRSRATGAALTSLGPVESVEHVEPSVISGGPPIAAGDVWSLAVTLHVALAGVGPYGDLTGVDPLLAVRRVLTTTPEPADSLTAQEKALLTRCWAKDEAARPSSAESLAQEVEGLGAAAAGGGSPEDGGPR